MKYVVVTCKQTIDQESRRKKEVGVLLSLRVNATRIVCNHYKRNSRVQPDSIHVLLVELQALCAGRIKTIELVEGDGDSLVRGEGMTSSLPNVIPRIWADFEFPRPFYVLLVLVKKLR